MGDKSSVPQGRGSNNGDIRNGYRLLIIVKKGERSSIRGGAAPQSALEAGPGREAAWPKVLAFKLSLNLQLGQKLPHARQTTVEFRNRSGIGNADMIPSSEAFSRHGG